MAPTSDPATTCCQQGGAQRGGTHIANHHGTKRSREDRPKLALGFNTGSVNLPRPSPESVQLTSPGAQLLAHGFQWRHSSVGRAPGRRKATRFRLQRLRFRILQSPSFCGSRSRTELHRECGSAGPQLLQHSLVDLVLQAQLRPKGKLLQLAVLQLRATCRKRGGKHPMWKRSWRS